MEKTRCYFLKSTDLDGIFLRRYSSASKCTGRLGFHNSEVKIGEASAAEKHVSGDSHDHTDERWPAKCCCGYLFKETDQWQLHYASLWHREDTNQIISLSEALPGAMWFAEWMDRKGWDGKQLEVLLPDGHVWSPDNRASNCSLPNDEEHRCWVRHGDPPNVTVDKNGKTCSAGAGSILSRSGWHGFLRDGWLEQC